MIFDVYNTKDESYISKLGKASGIALIRKYLPHIDANKQFYIVNNLEEWNEIKDKFPEIVTCRTDTVIGEKMPNEALFIRNKYDMMKNQDVLKYVVSDDEYRRTRQERIEF